MCIRDRDAAARKTPQALVLCPTRELAVQVSEAIYKYGRGPVSYTHLRAHETVLDLVCRLLLEKKKTNNNNTHTQQPT